MEADGLFAVRVFSSSHTRHPIRSHTEPHGTQEPSFLVPTLQQGCASTEAPRWTVLRPTSFSQQGGAWRAQGKPPGGAALLTNPTPNVVQGMHTGGAGPFSAFCERGRGVGVRPGLAVGGGAGGEARSVQSARLPAAGVGAHEDGRGGFLQGSGRGAWGERQGQGAGCSA